MSVAFAGQPRTPTYTTGFTEILKNPNSQSWGSGIIAFKEANGTPVTPSITNSSGERAALTAIVIKKGKNMVKTPVVLVGNWTSGLTKAKEAGLNRLLVVAVTGETAVMDNIANISLTYGGQLMTKQLNDQNGTTAFGNFSYIFTLNEEGIAASDASGTIVPTFTTATPTSGVDFFSAFYAKVDQTTPVSAMAKINLNGPAATAPISITLLAPARGGIPVILLLK